MLKYRIIYIFAASAAVAFATAYSSKLTLVLLLTVLILPLVSILILLIQRFSLSFETDPKYIFTVKQRQFTITVKIRNRFIFPISPMKITGVFQDGEGNLITDKLMLVSVMPFCRRELVFSGHLKYRGEYLLGITGAELYDFLGIAGIKIKLEPKCRTVVAPRRLTVGKSGALCTDDSDSRRTSFTFFENDTFSSVREYGNSDSLRRVHWKLSAKMDKLMVKQSDLNLSSSATVLIDTSAENHGSVSGQRQVDAVLEASLAVIRKIIGDGNSAACVYRNEEKAAEIILAETAEDYEYLYYKFSVIPVCPRNNGAQELAEYSESILRRNEPVFIIAPELKANELKAMLSGSLAAAESVRIFLTEAEASPEFLAVVNSDRRVRVAVIDPENIALSLENAMFD